MENEIMKEDRAKEILDKIKENIDMSNLEEMIKNNFISWKYNDSEYRVRLLNRIDKDELYILLVKKLNSLLVDIEIKKESELKQIYKEKRNIDFDEIDKQIRKLQNERLSVQLKLGQAISEKVEESGLAEYRRQIEEISESIIKINIQKENLLAHSLEKILEAYELEAKTWLALDKKTDGEWKRMFNTFEEFRSFEDDVLITKAAHYNLLIQIK